MTTTRVTTHSYDFRGRLSSLRLMLPLIELNVVG